MHCKEKDCSGNLELGIEVAVMVGCAQYASAYPCSTCGRLHWPSGSAVFNRSGKLVFLKDGQLVLKDPPKTD